MAEWSTVQCCVRLHLRELSLFIKTGIITDRVHSTRGGYIFSLFVCSHLGGVPNPADGGVPHPRSRWGGGYPISGPGGRGYPIQLMGGYPGRGAYLGYPPSRSRWGPTQGYPPRSRWGPTQGYPPIQV